MPTRFQEYRVVGNEQHEWDLFNRTVVEQPLFGLNLTDAMLSVVTVTASSANQVIYYDHWEDNTDGDGVADFEQDIVDTQTQAQTLVLGELISKAQARYARDGVDKYLLDVYNLIGDPATVVK